MKKHFALKVALASLCLAGGAFAAPVTPGNILVVRVGDGSTAFTNLGNAVAIQEYTPEGSLVQTFSFPSTGVSPRLVLSGTATSEGALTISPNGRYVGLYGYDAAAPNASSLTSTTSAAVNRIVAVLDTTTGTVDLTTKLTDGSSGNNPRSAIVADNGTDIWTGGGAGGVRYATLGATTSTQLATDLTNTRVLGIFGGKLYVSSASGTNTYRGVNTFATNLPTTTGQTTTRLPGLSDTLTNGSYAFNMFDSDAGVTGVDELFIADDSGTSAAVGRFTFDGITWTQAPSGSLITGTATPRGLAVVNGSSKATFYLTNGSTSLFKATLNKPFTTGNTASALVTLTGTYAFRGVVVVPDAVAPTVTSIVRQSPTSATTNAASVTFRVTFSESVLDVDSSDFTVDATGLAGAAVTGVTPVNSSTYDVAVSTGTGDSGTLSIDVPGTATITDNSFNAFATPFTAGGTYNLDRVAPTVLLSSSVPSLTNAVSFSVTATLSEASSDFDAGDVTTTNASVSNFAGGPTVYTFDVTPTADGAVTVQVAAGAFTDAATNASTTASNTISTTSDRTAPTSSAAVADATQVGTIAGTLSASDANGITSVTLYARLAPSGTWASVGDFSGTFSFSPATAGSYYLQSAATDAAGNAETAPTGSTGTGDAAVTFNTAPNAAFTQTLGADGTFTFPMESSLDVTVDLTGVTPGTLTVSRSVGDAAPAGFQADQLIDQAITFTTGGGLAFTGANVTVEYDEALLGGLTETAITSAYRDDAGTVTGPFAVTVNSTLNTITFPATGFSTWYFGTATASVDEWMLLD